MQINLTGQFLVWPGRNCCECLRSSSSSNHCLTYFFLKINSSAWSFINHKAPYLINPLLLLVLLFISDGYDRCEFQYFAFYYRLGFRFRFIAIHIQYLIFHTHWETLLKKCSRSLPITVRKLVEFFTPALWQLVSSFSGGGNKQMEENTPAA